MSSDRIVLNKTSYATKAWVLARKMCPRVMPSFRHYHYSSVRPVVALSVCHHQSLFTVHKLRLWACYNEAIRPIWDPFSWWRGDSPASPTEPCPTWGRGRRDKPGGGGVRRQHWGKSSSLIRGAEPHYFTNECRFIDAELKGQIFLPAKNMAK